MSADIAHGLRADVHLTRAIVYCRVSTADQKDNGTSLDTQKEACLSKAVELGAEVPHEAIISEDHTGTDLDRKGLQSALLLSDTGNFKYLILYKLDRLYRPETEGDSWRIFPLLQKLEARGLIVVSVLGNSNPGDPVSSLMTFMDSWQGGREREAIRERTMRGKRRIAEMGRIPQPMGRFSPYGTRWDTSTKKLVWISEDHRQNVRKILDACLGGETIRGIVKALNANGIPATAGGIWRRSSTHRVLKHAKLYAGTATWSGIDIPDALDHPVCSIQEVSSIDRKLARNKERANGFGRRRWLSGRVFGRCGHRYSIAERGARCQGADHSLPVEHRCDDKSIGLKSLELKVFQAIQKLLADPSRLRMALLNDLVERDFESQKIEDQRHALHNQLDTLEKRRRQLSIHHETGVISDSELSARHNRIKEQHEQAEESLQDLKHTYMSPEPLTAWLDSKVSEVWAKQALNLGIIGERIANRDMDVSRELDGLAEELNIRITVQNQNSVMIQLKIPDHFLLPTDSVGQDSTDVSILSNSS